MEILLILLVSVSLSMDTFSLALVYGTLNMSKHQKYILSSLVGIFHFFMPILGMILGTYILSVIKINPNVLVCIILLFIGFQMILETLKCEEEIRGLNIVDFLLFSFAVSIDSFSVGITLPTISNNYFVSITSFAICSFAFTLFGLIVGSKVQKLVGKIATTLGGVILIVIGLFYII